MGVFLNAVALYIAEASEDDPIVQEMKMFFGSLFMTMGTLFMVVSGGVDWWDVVKLLLEIHVVYGLVFLLFVVITVLALLNVINSIFVNDAMDTALKDIDLRMKHEADQTKFMVGFIRLKGGAILIDNFILLQELTSIVKQTMRENSRTLQAVVSVLRFENAGRLASVTETLPESPLAK